MKSAYVVALLGAESTGKTTLARKLTQALQAQGYLTVMVEEHLRSWCASHGRVPLEAEQPSIAAQQSEHIRDAMLGNDVVVADTTALMTAVYSDYVFGDPSLYSSAMTVHKNYGLTLVMGLDLPWVADGLLRDGPQVRTPVDALLRDALHESEIPFATIYGQGNARLASALAATGQALQRQMNSNPIVKPKWHHYCECCSDGESEKKQRNAAWARLR